MIMIALNLTVCSLNRGCPDEMLRIAPRNQPAKSSPLLRAEAFDEVISLLWRADQTCRSTDVNSMNETCVMAISPARSLNIAEESRTTLHWPIPHRRGERGVALNAAGIVALCAP